MRLEGNVSKVAICPKCNCHVMAGHIDMISEESEKEFTQFTNEGFVVKVETIDETTSRDLGSYVDCSKGLCLASPKDLVESV